MKYRSEEELDKNAKKLYNFIKSAGGKGRTYSELCWKAAQLKYNFGRVTHTVNDLKLNLSFRDVRGEFGVYAKRLAKMGVVAKVVCVYITR